MISTDREWKTVKRDDSIKKRL